MNIHYSKPSHCFFIILFLITVVFSTDVFAQQDVPVTSAQDKQDENENEQEDWNLGSFRLEVRRSSDPLKYRLSGEKSLKDYRFVGRVGGVAFAAVAELGQTLQGKSLQLKYNPSNLDGDRFAVIVGEEVILQSLPDWILLPVARYANSESNACVSLFGAKTTDESYDIVYHLALADTMLGLRLLQADILLIDLAETWMLPKKNGRTILGLGETEQNLFPRSAANILAEAMQLESFQSWVLTDVGERVQVELDNGKLYFTGQPYYYFWRSDFDAYQREIDRLIAEAQQYRKTGKVAEHNAIIDRVNKMVPTVTKVENLTNKMKTLHAEVHKFNPAVSKAVEATVFYAALFRYIRAKDPGNWQQFLTSLPPVSSLPLVRTPTRWVRPH